MANISKKKPNKEIIGPMVILIGLKISGSNVPSLLPPIMQMNPMMMMPNPMARSFKFFVGKAKPVLFSISFFK